MIMERLKMHPEGQTSEEMSDMSWYGTRSLRNGHIAGSCKRLMDYGCVTREYVDGVAVWHWTGKDYIREVIA